MVPVTIYIYVWFIIRQCDSLGLSDDEVHSHGAIDPAKPLEELRQEPYSLPAGFEWDSLDIDNPLVVSD